MDSPSRFKNRKKATYKQGGFAIHARSDRHKQAMIAWRDYQTAVTVTILYIKTIREVLLLTATQNIAQRGHDESAASDNKGNIMAILETIANHDKAIKKG